MNSIEFSQTLTKLIKKDDLRYYDFIEGHIGEIKSLATDFLGLIEVTQDALDKIKDVVAYWPIEVDHVREYLEKLK